MQCAGAAAFAAYFGISGSTTAAVSCILAAIQLLTVVLTRDRRVVRLVFTTTLACLGVMVTWTWNGIPTALASCGCLLSTLARMQPTTHRMKIWFLLAAPFWVAHNMLTTSLLALGVDALSIASNGASILALRTSFIAKATGLLYSLERYKGYLASFGRLLACASVMRSHRKNVRSGVRRLFIQPEGIFPVVTWPTRQKPEHAEHAFEEASAPRAIALRAARP